MENLINEAIDMNRDCVWVHGKLYCWDNQLHEFMCYTGTIIKTDNMPVEAIKELVDRPRRIAK